MKRRLSTVLVLLALAGAAWACRYSVRDTGFVDLGDENYQLVLSGPATDGRADLYRRIAAASLLDANITFSVREETGSTEPVLTLESQDGRKLVLARGKGLPADAAGATTLLESVALSPLRAEIHEAALSAYAVVVMIEGGRAAEVARVQAAIDGAVRHVTRLMPSMPKPVDTPPRVIRVTADRIPRERVTLWGLGFDPEPVREPRVALVFGRARRIGSPLEGPFITQTVLQERLVIIGQDCECELDRAWMKGPLLPARWDADRQRQAVQTLGFDPENPMVRAEVSRIVLRGPGTGQFRKLAGPVSGLGYSEVWLDDLPVAEPAGVIREQAVEPEPEPEPLLGTEVAASTGVTAAVGGPTGPGEAGPPPKVVAATSPLEQTRQFSWWIVVTGVLVILTVAGAWWRKIRREQG